MQEFFERRITRVVRIGEVLVGGDNPIAVQTMVTAPTANVEAVVNQVVNLARAGAEIIRITAPTFHDIEPLSQIRAKINSFNLRVGLVADVHHKGSKIAIAAAPYVDKVRINPGLFVDRGRAEKDDYTPLEVSDQLQAIEDSLRPVLAACRENDATLRIGVNHGSLSNRLLVMYGDTPEGMVESAMEYLRICERNNFYNLVISLKSSRVPVMIAANRLMVVRMDQEGMSYPLHLGVTEAGKGQYARIKSSAGIATLLMEGLGDTIRVSLSEDPINEIAVCYDLLQSVGLRRTKPEYIGCPSCGRTKFDLELVLTEVQDATAHLPAGLNIAVMGCIVNGPGEMIDADYGYVGEGGGKITLYKKGEVFKRGIPQEEGLSSLVTLLKTDRVWVDPQSVV
ncbi:(E)-4-hydroxy-3-methylbut-2-enyl-diphosphate synthase [Candidatus Daviesbacteria bacterium]|nr:(E)-4-hydroxy-3-methylbut-2-enyl-diphosphate synthase [Candidatus Daviesbacteria bacterium]